MKLCNSYNYSWAVDVYTRFCKSYPRATQIFKIISNHPENYGAWLLAHDPDKWNRYKKIIKSIARYDDRAGNARMTKRLYQFYEEMLWDSHKCYYSAIEDGNDLNYNQRAEFHRGDGEAPAESSPPSEPPKGFTDDVPYTEG